jgi:hypothetical protein
MRAILVGLMTFALAVPTPPAAAQTPSYLQRPTAVGVQFTLRVPLKSDDLDDQRNVMENGRRQLYEIGAQECAAILATLASSCKLSSLNIQSNNLRLRPEDNFVTLTANAQYQVEFKSSEAAAKEQSNRP